YGELERASSEFNEISKHLSRRGTSENRMRDASMAAALSPLLGTPPTFAWLLGFFRKDLEHMLRKGSAAIREGSIRHDIKDSVAELEEKLDDLSRLLRGEDPALSELYGEDKLFHIVLGI